VSLAKEIGATYRDKDTLVSGVARHLLTAQSSDRRSDVIHPSEASHEHWCPRATYYRISGVEAAPQSRKLAFEMAFETGHDAHRKWQGWFWEMGLLKGTFKCLNCDLYWWDQSPYWCPRCEVGKNLLRYTEVPVSSPEYLLVGSADGDVVRSTGDSVLIEVKTIGTGTVRIEAPKLMERFTTPLGVDWYKLWQSIRRPFPSHLRQGMIYCFCYGREKITYIYDPKFITAYPKEFEIRLRMDIIQPVLDQCLKIKSALERGRTPKRPVWADETAATCKQCPYYSHCYGQS
jgi:CRISPR/Cas system-associated exonuclease Cas4 (RecB family)